MRPKLLPLILLIAIAGQAIAQNSFIRLHSGWKAKKASEVLVDGTTITGKNFQFYGWMDAVVPGTVLTTLLQNQKVPTRFSE